MRMRASPGLFLLLLMIGAIIVPTRRLPATGPSGTWHVGQSTNAQGGSGQALLEQPEGSRANITAAYGKLPLSFEANRGQTDARVQFISRGSGYTLYLTATEAVLTLQRPLGFGEPRAGPGSPLVFSKRKGLGETQNAKPKERENTAHSTLRMKLVGANVTTVVESLQPLPGKSNYFIGNDPAKWRTDIPIYAKVRYKAIYPGADLVYYGNQQQLEYDFVLAPGADPRIIRLAIAGSEKLEAGTDGGLVLRTSGGEVRLHKPIVYQRVSGTRKEVTGRYVLRGKREIGFEVAAYDIDKPLIIDPVLSYSTYLGGSAGDFGNAIAVDASGNAYVTGETSSINFPTKNPSQSASGGGVDAFVAKLDPTGSTLVYSTYLGGGAGESGKGIAVDASGNAYVTGSTSSSNFPTKNPFQAAFGGGSDVFVAKLDTTGSLIYSTFLGGSGDESGKGIAADPLGNAYITGFTNAPNFPKQNPFQPALGGANDAFVVKLDPTGSALVYSTFLGGTLDDFGNGIAVDSLGNAYATGNTLSTNFPTKNPLQPALGGASDAFVAKLDPTGSALVYSTFLGGTLDDFGNGIAVDSLGNVYATGNTLSTNFPTASPLQANCQSCANGQGNAFVAKLNAAGSALMYSTYLGGSGNGSDGDFGNGIAVDASNSAYVTGFTSSQDFPLASPIQATLLPQTCTFDYFGYTYTIPCSNTAFVTKLNPSGSALLFSTYLGASGGNLEYGSGIAVDGAGSAYVTGRATSNFLLTPGAIQLVSGGGDDAFVAKINLNDAPGFSLDRFNLNFSDEGVGGTTQPQTITLANTGSATLTIASIVPSGDFAETNNCGGSLAGGTACTINVTFTPTAAGVRTGNITITDNMASSPQIVTMTGNGVTGLAATVSPTSLSFGNQTQGTISVAQRVTLTNTGSGTLTITGFSFAGTNPSDFTLSSTDCKQSQSLAVGASCAFNIAFAPLAVGNRSATLQITDNSAQSPRSVTLTGVGIAPPTVTLSAISLSFAAQVVGSTSQPQTITLTTSGSGTLAVFSISTTTSDFAASNNCGTVAGGASCTITVTFTPSAIGNRTGMLVIASNAANGTQMVSLSGPGTDFSISPAAGSTNSATVTAGQSATYTLSAAGSSGFSGTVSFSCSDPAFQSSCAVSPNSLMVNGTTTQNATVTVTTTARSALPPRWRPPILPPNLRVTLPWLLLLLSLVILTRALRRRSRRRRAWVGLAAMLMAAALFFGCGGGAPPQQNGTPAGTYLITVSAASAGATRSTMLTLTVR